MTEEDIKLLNTRVVDTNGVTLPKTTEQSDTTYACPNNKQRNTVNAGICDSLIKSDLFPKVDDKGLPPDHTIFVEADIQSCNTNESTGKTRVSRELCERIISTCGDGHCQSSTKKRVDPCLRLYPGAHSMVTDNSRLKSDKVGNGTLCRVRGVKLKNNAPPLT